MRREKKIFKKIKKVKGRIEKRRRPDNGKSRHGGDEGGCERKKKAYVTPWPLPVPYFPYLLRFIHSTQARTFYFSIWVRGVFLLKKKRKRMHIFIFVFFMSMLPRAFKINRIYPIHSWTFPSHKYKFSFPMFIYKEKAQKVIFSNIKPYTF